MSSYTLHSVFEYGKQQLRDAGVDSWQLDARLLLMRVLSCSHEALLLQRDAPCEEQKFDDYKSLLIRRAAFEPMAYIRGTQEFYGYDFAVTRDTLIPRPDSETLINTVLAWSRDKALQGRLLDIGTGSGCLLLTLLRENDTIEGVGIDISSNALDIARHNALRLGVEKRGEFLHKSWEEAEFPPQSFDIIISNPPYIPEADVAGLMPDVRNYEPHTALAGGGDGLACYRSLIPYAARWLKPGGLLALEIGQGQEKAVGSIGKAQGLMPYREDRDIAGIIRVVSFIKEK